VLLAQASFGSKVSGFSGGVDGGGGGHPPGAIIRTPATPISTTLATLFEIGIVFILFAYLPVFEAVGTDTSCGTALRSARDELSRLIQFSPWVKAAIRCE
jgi:hypothetical protein